MKVIKSLLLKTRFLWLGITSIGQLHIGDTVKYNGKTCVLVQGVSHPKWHMHDVKTNERFEYVHVDDFKKLFWKNVWWDIESTYRFYMMNWYDIFMRAIPMSKCLIVDYSNWSQYRTE